MQSPAPTIANAHSISKSLDRGSRVLRQHQGVDQQDDGVPHEKQGTGKLRDNPLAENTLEDEKPVDCSHQSHD